MMIGKGLPYTRSHRHYSHLLMFYPLYLLKADQTGSRELMERSGGALEVSLEGEIYQSTLTFRRYQSGRV